MTPTRRTLVLQLVSLATLAACEGPTPKGDGAAAPGDTDSPDTDTADTAADTDTADSGDTDTDTADTDSGDTDTGDPSETGVDTGEAVDVCAEPAPLSKTCAPTSRDGEGPYFRTDAPERSALNVRGDSGTRLVLAGRLLDADCQPVAGARVYLWHAGPDGRYDTDSADANLYGYVVTGDDGAFCFDTLRPPPYTDGMGGFNAAHLHVNVLLADEKVLTTQLYFAGDPNLEVWTDVARQLVPEPFGTDAERVVFDFVLPAGAR